MEKKTIFILMILIAMVLLAVGIILLQHVADPETEPKAEKEIDIRSLPLYCQVKYTDLKGDVTYLLNPACAE